VRPVRSRTLTLGVFAPDVRRQTSASIRPGGLFQISAAAHQVNGSYNVLNGSLAGLPGTTAIFGCCGSRRRDGPCELQLRPVCRKSMAIPETKWGGSVMAALQIKNIPTGAGDDIKIDANLRQG